MTCLISVTFDILLVDEFCTYIYFDYSVLFYPCQTDAGPTLCAVNVHPKNHSIYPPIHGVDLVYFF